MCEHYGTVLSETHRHHINSLEHDNCVLCLAEQEGPMTQEKIASYLGVTKERISQIEKAALKKVKDTLPFDLKNVVLGKSTSFSIRDQKVKNRGILHRLVY